MPLQLDYLIRSNLGRIHGKNLKFKFIFFKLLAIYDRFGRLALGSDTLPKDILEYVVFERYLTNPYSSWRLHDKISNLIKI